jgi:undecaprenyl-diphosphatase
MDQLEAIDQGALNAFHNLYRVPALHPLLIGLAYLGDSVVLLVVLLLGVLALHWQRQPRAAWLVVGATVIALLLTYAAKALVHRDLPNVGWTVLKPNPWEWQSFPSACVALATVVYGSLGVLLARRTASRRGAITLLVLAFVLPLLAGAARLFLGHSYLTDVLAGWAVGAMLAMVCADLDRRLHPAAPAGGPP